MLVTHCSIIFLIVLAIEHCKGNIRELGLLEFGNNDFGNTKITHRTDCNPQQENALIRRIREAGKNQSLSWIENKYRKSCNVFMYLRCDAFTGKCICWHEDLFWAPNVLQIDPQGYDFVLEQVQVSTEVSVLMVEFADPDGINFGRYEGRCRVMTDRPYSCNILNSTVLEKYSKPYNLEIFDVLPPPDPSYEIRKLESSHLMCVKNAWDNFGHYTCVTPIGELNASNACMTDLYFLKKEMEIIGEIQGKSKDWKWSFPPNDICDVSLQKDFQRNQLEHTWDFEKIREIIFHNKTREYCNPFAYQICHNGICSCPPPVSDEENYHGDKTLYYSLKFTRCMPTEGIACSRRYWYNGNWVDFLDECDEHLMCVEAPDKINKVCCDPDEMEINLIDPDDRDKGRCRDRLLHGEGGMLWDCANDFTGPSSLLLIQTILILINQFAYG